MSAPRIQKLLQTLNWKVNNHNLFHQALTHSSYAYEHNLSNGHNERLEFLGDAVLEVIISDYLYNHYPDYPEGKLTRMRADIVCEPTLARLAENIGLGECLLLGKGESAGGGSKRPSLLSDALEALIGALYLDLGFTRTYELTVDLFAPVFKELEKGSFGTSRTKTLQRLFLTPS